MFKNLIIYRIAAPLPFGASGLADLLAKETFQPCAPTQPLSVGWAPPRGIEHAPLVEAVDGHWLLKLQREQRILPGSVVNDRVEELAEQVEQTTGRKPGRKARKDLKEQATHDLLPRAFTKTGATRVWVARHQRLLLVDAGSVAKSDEVVSLLTHAIPGLSLRLLQTAIAPAAFMAAWLRYGLTPEGFQIERELELKGLDEQRPIVRYARHPLDIEEIRAHLVAGKMPTRIALSWRDRVSFTLTENLTLKKISFLDLAFDGRPEVAGDDSFDADLALATGELSQLIPALIDGLGGEFEIKA